MNLKKTVDFTSSLKGFEENNRDPKKNSASHSELFSLEKDFREILKGFEIHPHDVTTSGLVEVYPNAKTSTPNLYLNEVTAEDRTRGNVGRSRLLRISPIKATAEFVLLGASIRFRTYDLFVEFDSNSGDYLLCISSAKGNDNDYIKTPASSGVELSIQNGSWRA